jgi:glutamate-1-semialdehyde 2,1-aminomutase
MDMLRFTNSGTEATLYAIRAAKAFTKRDMFIKIDGGYHGTHDAVEVSIYPRLETVGLPSPQLEERGISASVLDDVAVAPFNDLEAMETLLQRFEGKIAGIITEPVLVFGGSVPPKEGYLQGLRELADKYEVLLIFDEIVTFRFSRGGSQELWSVDPDITALGKAIGGGFPIGAFGGKKEIMTQFDPTGPDPMMHSGTFSGNHITMAAGIAALEKYDDVLIDRTNKLGDKLRDGFNQGFRKAKIKGQATGFGSVLQVHYGDKEISTAKDVKTILKSAKKLPQLFHLEMLNRGINPLYRDIFCTSTPMTDKEIDRTLREFEETLEVLKPYVTEETPHLLDTA